MIANNYMILGFRRNTNDIHSSLHLEDEILKRQNWTLVTYMSYFMLSIYISYYNQDQVDKAEFLASFNEEKFKSIFMFEKSHKKKSRDNDESRAKDERRFSQFQGGSKVYKKDDSCAYTADDLIDHYENARFSLPFIVYRRMNLWPFFDFFATYCGHAINNLFIVIIAINFNVSVIMCFEIFCVCYLYMMATVKLNKNSVELYKSSGLQSQCDLGMARIITKKF